MLAAVGGRAMWYLTRGTGMMAYLLLTISVLLGILEVNRWQSPRWPRFVTAGLHRRVSLLSVAFVAVHVATTVVDGFAPIGWLDAVIPFRSPYRPVWLGLGAVAVDLLLALVVTSLLRGRLGYRAFRAVHWAAYACWPVAVVHGLGTGTDTPQAWAIAVNGICLAAIVAAVWWRLAVAWRDRATTSSRDTASGVVISATMLSVVLPAAIVAWLLVGPLQPGWARRAGTPSALRRTAPAVGVGTAPTAIAASGYGSGTPTPTVTSAVAPPAIASFRLPATASLRGRVTQATGSDGQGTVSIDATLNSPTTTLLDIVLRGPVLAAGGITMEASQVTAGPVARPALYDGTVTALQGSDLTLALTGPGGAQVVLQANLDIVGTTVSGTVTEVGSGA